MADWQFHGLLRLWAPALYRRNAALFRPFILPFLSAGQEKWGAELDAWLRHAQSRFGDEMLRYTGIGEVVHFGCHDFEGLEDFAISGESLEELRRISYRTAGRGWPMNIHAVTDSSITAILDC